VTHQRELQELQLFLENTSMTKVSNYWKNGLQETFWQLWKTQIDLSPFPYSLPWDNFRWEMSGGMIRYSNELDILRWGCKTTWPFYSRTGLFNFYRTLWVGIGEDMEMDMVRLLVAEKCHQEEECVGHLLFSCGCVVQVWEVLMSMWSAQVHFLDMYSTLKPIIGYSF